MRAISLLFACNLVSAGCRNSASESEPSPRTEPASRAEERTPEPAAAPLASSTRRPSVETAVANFDRAREIVDPYFGVDGDIESPVYPSWAEIRPRLDPLLGPPTHEERSTDGSTRYFWAFAALDQCHFFTFWVNERGEGHGGVEIGHESEPDQPREVDAHAECVGWASGKRVGILYKTG